MTEAYEKFPVPLYRDGAVVGTRDIIVSPRTFIKLNRCHYVKYLWNDKREIYVLRICVEKGVLPTTMGQFVLKIEGLSHLNGMITVHNRTEPLDFRPYNLRVGGESITHSTPCVPNRKPVVLPTKKEVEPPKSAVEIPSEDPVEMLRKLSEFSSYAKNINIGGIHIEEIYFDKK